MIKIGLFLESLPNHGGAFQYDIAILDAVATLPTDKYKVTVFYIDPVWIDYIEAYSVEKVCYNPSTTLTDKILNKSGSLIEPLCKRLKLPLGFWRKISSYFDPLARAVTGLGCSFWIFPSQNCWVYKIDVKAIVSIHDLMHRYEKQFPEVSADGEFERREFRFSNICRYAEGVLVDSKLGRRQVHESYNMPHEKIHVLPFIPPRYVLDARELNAHEKKEFESRYDLPERFVFYPAQFWLHKNHGRLIEAVSLVKKEHPDIKLVLVGSSNKNGYETARKFVDELGLQNNVIFIGYVPDGDMPEFYRRSRALVMPTFFGPTNIPPLEAFALECPVAISGIYGMREQLGDAAIFFDPESVEDIAGCINRLWSDDKLCAALIAKGKERTKCWGQNQFNQRLLEIIESIDTK